MARGVGIVMVNCFCKDYANANNSTDWWQAGGDRNRINCTGEKGRGGAPRQTELSRNCQSKTLRADEIKSGWKLEVHISLSLSLISEKIMKYEVNYIFSV